MKSKASFYLAAYSTVLGAFALAVFSIPAGAAPEPVPRSLALGSVEFTAPTKPSMFTIKGTVKKLTGSARLKETVLEELTLEIPVEEVTTHMGVRDDHMRDQIFKNPADGKYPPVRLQAKSVQCEKSGAELHCPLKGELLIRGKAAPFSSSVKIVPNGKSLKAQGQGTVLLSAYGIPQPKRLGVTVQDAIALRFEVELQ